MECQDINLIHFHYLIISVFYTYGKIDHLLRNVHHLRSSLHAAGPAGTNGVGKGDEGFCGIRITDSMGHDDIRVRPEPHDLSAHVPDDEQDCESV